MDLFKRKLYTKLTEWKKNSNESSGLLIEGARRTGKTTLAKEFARREYESSLYIDFSHVDKQVIDIFRDYRSDIQTLLRMLQLFTESNCAIAEASSSSTRYSVSLLPERRSNISSRMEAMTI